MSTFKGIDCLPLETQQMVLRAMSDIKTLVVTIHASPLMRRAFDSYSNPILGEVLVMNTMKSAADVFPLAVALNHLTTKFSSNQAASDPPGYNQKITNFCRSYLKNLHTFSIVDAGLSLKMAMNIESTYLRMVDIAQQFGMYVCDCAKIERGVSISESQRFLKAVYIYELARVLFRTRIMNEDGTEYSTALHTFWTSFAPWEAAQVQAFERFLQKLLVDKGQRSC
ncbi:uncharacterized protein BCR38DRAFT_50114 [Pseudomassariella vexata]|uniref:Uncharacterized protein n=1 Tax=Pseudomassariella vexata TaxID=1141098 RepID=A0A1Y2DNY3_9PEZI|nr:uncharacterized protein BCR38DRAFT_50114 [Pseudomassariella vexata]ORY60988.1 hypothetical protein BCR38DRAFT_50114 [Pseudomassariella vexata]